MGQLAMNTSSAQPPVGILNGYEHAGDPFRRLGAMLSDGEAHHQRRWLIDARASRHPIALIELACFANQVRVHPEQFSNLAIAWVEESPMSSCLRSILDSLPLAFHEFKSFDAAVHWFNEDCPSC
jgi:hypothetical protein